MNAPADRRDCDATQGIQTATLPCRYCHIAWFTESKTAAGQHSVAEAGRDALRVHRRLTDMIT